MADLKLIISEGLADQLDELIEYLTKQHVTSPKDSDALIQLAFHIQEGRHANEIKERLREIEENRCDG